MVFNAVAELTGTEMAMGAANGERTPQESNSCLYVNDSLNDSVLNGIQSEDEGPDDELKAPSMLIFDQEFNHGTLQGLSKLRKNRQFCDVVLQVTKN